MHQHNVKNPEVVMVQADFQNFLPQVVCQEQINRMKHVHEPKAEKPQIHWHSILALLAGVLSQMLCWGLIMTYGTILAFYTRYLIPEVDETLVSVAGAIPPFCLLFLALPWGRLLDAGHHRELNVLAGISLAGGMVSLAFTGSNNYNSGKYWAIVLASIPMGIGQSIYFLAAPQCAKTWYPNHKGFAMGITNSGAALGGVAWPLAFNTLVDQFGFRISIATLAGISCVLSIFIAIFGRPSPSFSPRSIGQDFSIRNWWPTRAFHSQVFRIHTAAMCFVYLGILTIPFFLELWARRSGDIGVSEDTSSGFGVDDDGNRPLEEYLLVTLNACQLPGRLFGSMLCDKMRARKIHAVACLITISIIGAFWFTTASYAVGMLFAALFGLTLGVMVSLPINDAQDLLGNARTHLLGQYAGAVYTCASPFVLSGAVISGALVSRFDVYVAPAVWCMCCFTVGGVLITLSLWVEDDTYLFDERPPQIHPEKAVVKNRSRASTGLSVASSATAVSSGALSESRKDEISERSTRDLPEGTEGTLSRCSTWSNSLGEGSVQQNENAGEEHTTRCGTTGEPVERHRHSPDVHVHFDESELQSAMMRMAMEERRGGDRRWSWMYPGSEV